MEIRHLMLIDDDEDDREIFLSVLESIAPAARCAVATNGQDAMSKLNSASLLPEIIFLDLNMPLMDGKQFLREVKRSDLLRKIPVIVLSTSSDRETIIQTRDLGAEKFITKPDRYSGWEEKLKDFFGNASFG
jgi:CheY-like chemotaxis protein